METKVSNNGTAKTANQNNVNNSGKINNLPVSTAFNDKKDEAKAGEAKPETAKPTPEPAKIEPAKTEAAAPAQEPSKKDLKEQFQKQQERKLEDTVKLVEALGKKIAQKNKLQNTITNLDEFTVSQNEEDDMASDSKFHRCELTISDDDGKEFTTKNPFIIAYVAHEVKQLCIDKLAEVEASIVIPF